VLFPYQTCPEHKHIGSDKAEGKEETFRVRRGLVYLYVEGKKVKDIKAKAFNSKTTVFNEVTLNAGEQYTLSPNTKHWFQAGREGAVVSEFSTKSSDETDVFTDKKIARTTLVKD
jgi:D-lyxose ketol-isomerase